jgi:MarR family transcriptional regulator, 2-MHQ and catechol-resistance regulon repressor
MSGSKPVEASRLWIVLSRCYRAVRHVAERSISDAGLCLSDFAALEALLHKGPLTITEIQAKALLASGSMTAAVDRLESKGLLCRKTIPNDRRAKVLQLTGKGKRLVETVFRTHAAELEAIMAPLSQNEKRWLYRLLRKLGLFAAGLGARGGKAQTASAEKAEALTALEIAKHPRGDKATSLQPCSRKVLG